MTALDHLDPDTTVDAKPAGGLPAKRALVDAAALRANAAALRRHVGDEVAVMAMVKANGYGHGSLTAARCAVAGGATWLGVSSPEEAVRLRRAGIATRMLVVGWSHPSWQPALVEARVDVTVYDEHTVASALHAARQTGRVAHVHIKVDSGMGRLGVRWRSFGTVLSAVVAARPHLRLSGVFTHFADADGVETSFTEEQHGRFLPAVERARQVEPDLVAHCANSAALLRFPRMHHDVVRPGVALYGYPPRSMAGVLPLRPALSVVACVTQVKTVRAGDTVGYGRSWTAPADRRIATVAAGYADGVSRAQSNRGCAVVHAVRCPIVGRISMDQLMLDVSDVEAVTPGDEVALIGAVGGDAERGWLGADEVAAAIGTVPYEVLCAVSARVPRQVLHAELLPAPE